MTSAKAADPRAVQTLGAHASRIILCVLVAALLLLFPCESSLLAEPGPAPQPTLIAAPDKLTNAMPVDEIRPGMKGYGLSVFHGTKIEPFVVEVVSVMKNFTPGGDVIWIHCPDERMQKSGPVHGMSGSPIYLWAEGEPQEPGKGGRLIGAFAYGYEATRDCYVGVQPITGMRNAGDRAPEQGKSTHIGTPADFTLEELLDLPGFRSLKPGNTYQARMAAKLAARPGTRRTDTADAARGVEFRSGTLAGRASRLSLPLNVGSPMAEELFGPVLERMGFAATYASGALAGAPPPGLDIQTAKLAPGSVLAIPLAWGDADLSASGTVTEVLPDGRVLAFGHAMFGQGDSAMPMATGFVHLVMPSIISSFKVGGSGVIQGSIVRDEQYAVVGKTGVQYTTAPVRVSVSMPGQPKRQYNYTVVNHRAMTPMLTAIVAMQSAMADQNQPLESTAHVRCKINFTGGRSLEINNLMPDGGPRDLAMNLFITLSLINQNPFTPLELTSADVELTVEPVRKLVTLVSARLDNNEVAPGDNVAINLRIQPYGKPSYERRLTFPIPRSLPDGDYNILVSGAQGYLNATLGSRPHLLEPDNVDELLDTLQRVFSARSNAIYMVMQLPEEGLAIGRQELPRLPSSRRALLTVPNSTNASGFVETLERTVPIEQVVEGELPFTITVRKSLADRSR